jgi:hypothetical protein
MKALVLDHGSVFRLISQSEIQMQILASTYGGIIERMKKGTETGNLGGLSRALAQSPCTSGFSIKWQDREVV